MVDGITVHPPRWADVKWDWVLISNAGFPEDEHFNPLRDMFERFAKAIGGGEYARVKLSICKGMGELLSNKPLLPEFEWFFDACRRAGREFVQDGCVQEETLAVLDRPFLEVTPQQSPATRPACPESRSPGPSPTWPIFTSKRPAL